MRRGRSFFTTFLLIGLFGTLLSVFLQAQSYRPPRITECVPSQIEVTQEDGELEVVLHGENFLIEGNEPVWNAREIILFVRHSAKGDQWQGLYNNLRDGGATPGTYGNPPRSFGKCYYDWDYKIRVWLPRRVWCDSPGTLEFLLVKGKWGEGPPPMRVTEKTRSNVLGVPVQKDVTGITRIDSLIPEYFPVNPQDSTILTIRGKFDYHTSVLVDNQALETVSANPMNGLISVQLPAPMLEHQALHQVRLSDSQNTVSNAKTFWVYGPPRVVAWEPERLHTHMQEMEIKIQYNGLIPGNVRIRSGDKPWATVPFATPKQGYLLLTLAPEWTSTKGEIELQLESAAGNTTVRIPVDTAAPVVKVQRAASQQDKSFRLRIPASNLKNRYELAELAAMIVDGKPPENVMDKAGDLFRGIHSESGVEAQKTDQTTYAALKELVDKEIRALEEDTGRPLNQARLDSIKGQLETIRKMARIAAEEKKTGRIKK